MQCKCGATTQDRQQTVDGVAYLVWYCPSCGRFERTNRILKKTGENFSTSLLTAGAKPDLILGEE